MEAVEKASCPSDMRVRASRSHLPHVPVFNPDSSSFLMGKVGLDDGIEVREEMPTPRLLAFSSGFQGDAMRRWYGIAIVLAVFMARYNGSHNDVQWHAGISETKCTFEDELTLMDK
jgi:hypothetical protein